MGSTTQLLEDSLLLIWNDRNADSRLDHMKRIYAPDIHFYESEDGAPIIGHGAVNELITKLQKEWPLEFRFGLNMPVRANHAVQMASWHLGPEGGQPVATGMDIAVVAHNLIRELYLFLDAPAA